MLSWLSVVHPCSGLTGAGSYSSWLFVKSFPCESTGLQNLVSETVFQPFKSELRYLTYLGNLVLPPGWERDYLQRWSLIVALMANACLSSVTAASWATLLLPGSRNET